jgi:N-acetylglucosaminyldiphosphoundecaprenol N-acetyl-beta-D-mannosaminyltransferase
MNEKRRLFGIDIDAVCMPQAVACLRTWIQQDADRCRYVVTPNVDHMVMLRDNADFREAYANADLILADGHPIVWVSHLLRRPLPQRVPGSELVPALFDSFNQRGALRVFLLGAAEGVAVRAAQNMNEMWPNVETVGVYSPPLGFEKNADETKVILRQIAACRPDVVVVGLGAPKQELWVHRHAGNIRAKVALCVGATIDFIAGEKKRAPRWMQRCGAEWLHRVATEPHRLFMRYAKDAWIFPQIVLQQMISQSR